MRFPVGARAWASVPPPAPVPMMMTSKWSTGLNLQKGLAQEGSRSGGCETGERYAVSVSVDGQTEWLSASPFAGLDQRPADHDSPDARISAPRTAWRCVRLRADRLSA